jgi:hypothetical protein
VGDTQNRSSLPIANKRDFINKGNGVEANYDMGGGKMTTQLVALVNFLVLKHGTEQYVQNVHGAF